MGYPYVLSDKWNEVMEYNKILAFMRPRKTMFTKAEKHILSMSRDDLIRLTTRLANDIINNESYAKAEKTFKTIVEKP